MATAEGILQPRKPFALVEAKFRGQLACGWGRGEGHQNAQGSQGQTSRSQCHSGPWGMEEGPCKEGPSGRRINTTFPSICRLLAFLSQFGPVTGCIQQQ